MNRDLDSAGKEGSRAVPDANELHKALNLLVHDLRTPLGVAQGYLRLLKDDRLASPEDRCRAWEQMGDALRRISRLCDDATAFSAGEPMTAPPIAVPVQDLVARLSRAFDVPSLDIDVMAAGRGVIRTMRLDPLADAVVTILASVTARRPGASVFIAEADTELQCMASVAGQRAALHHDTPLPFDPWPAGQGLALVSACRHVERAGGRIWTTASAAPGIGVALPLERQG